jgi:hypothetical protein
MSKQLRNLLLAFSIATATTACAIVPAPHYGYREARVEVVSVRPAPYYVPAPRYSPPPYREEYKREHFRHDHHDYRDRY